MPNVGIPQPSRSTTFNPHLPSAGHLSSIAASQESPSVCNTGQLQEQTEWSFNGAIAKGNNTITTVSEQSMVNGTDSRLCTGTLSIAKESDGRNDCLAVNVWSRSKRKSDVNASESFNDDRKERIPETNSNCCETEATNDNDTFDLTYLEHSGVGKVSKVSLVIGGGDISMQQTLESNNNIQKHGTSYLRNDVSYCKTDSDEDTDKEISPENAFGKSLAKRKSDPDCEVKDETNFIHFIVGGKVLVSS